MKVSKTIEISCAHILDLPYESKCNSQHGHGYLFTAYVEGDINDQGMVVDYTQLGGAMKLVLDTWDHKTFVPETRIIEREGESLRYKYPRADVWIPEKDAIILPYTQSTAENIAKYFWTILREILDSRGQRGFPLTVKVQETSKTESVYP